METLVRIYLSVVALLVILGTALCCPAWGNDRIGDVGWMLAKTGWFLVIPGALVAALCLIWS